MEQGGRNVYCSSARCVAALLKTGWHLSDASHLTTLVRELAAAPNEKTHEPSDHFH
jgi:hypothetical protein